MPPSLTIGAFVFGALLLLLALAGGGIKLFGAEITGTVGKVARTIAFILGLVFVTLGITGLDPRPVPVPHGSDTTQSGSINLSGTWKDEAGTVYEISQTGNHYTFSAVNKRLDFSANGEGTVAGTEYHSTYTRTSNIHGEATGSIYAHGDSSTAFFRDDTLGRFTRTLGRER